MRLKGSNAVKTIALMCAGLDDVRRGYETHMRLLTNTLRAESISGAKALLFKRSGLRMVDEIVLNTPARTSGIVRFLAKYRGDSLYWEAVFFVLGFIVCVNFYRIQLHLIYCPEPVVVRFLYRIRWLMPGRPRIILMHGVWMDPKDYVPFADGVHEVNIENYHKSRLYISPPKIIRHIPHFLHDDGDIQGRPLEQSRDIFRQRISLEAKGAILSVGVLSRSHKRIDYLINEASQSMPSDWILIVCGAPQEADLVEYGGKMLGSRFHHLYLEPHQMPLLYKAADIFVLCSTQEGFGLVLLEAMRSGRPILAHSRPLFHHIIGDKDQLVDMNQAGALASAISRVSGNPSWLLEKGLLNRQRFLELFVWPAVRERYLDILDVSS